MSKNIFMVTLRTTYLNFGLSTHEGREVSDNLLHRRLTLKCKSPRIDFSTGEKEKPVSLFNWHQGVGHHSTRTISDMAEGTVTGMVLKGIPKDIPKLDSWTFCTLTKSRHFPYDACDGTTRVDPLRSSGPDAC